MPTLPLTIETLKIEAATFARQEHPLVGKHTGKDIGTYIERKFLEHVVSKYLVKAGNSAKGIDLPELNVDIKTTRATKSQSSCPFKSARQKIFGLGYSLLIFTYNRVDDPANHKSKLLIERTVFIDSAVTADHATTLHLRKMIEKKANQEDIFAYLVKCNPTIDKNEAKNLAAEVLRSPPVQGYLTITPALQWRLKYSHALRLTDATVGVHDLTEVLL